MQKFYFNNLFLQKKSARIYLNITSLDMVAKVSSNDLLISIFCVGVEQF